MVDDVKTDDAKADDAKAGDVKADDVKTDDKDTILGAADKGDDKGNGLDKDADKAAAEAAAKSSAGDDKKAADAKAEDADKSKDSKADDDKTGAPETYAEFTVPDDMEMDKEALEAFIPIAKDLNLNQAGAQKLVDLYGDAVVKAAEQQNQAWSDMQDDWGKQTREDKEIGGTEENFDANVKMAQLTMDKLTTAEQQKALKEALNTSGIGNHPEVVRIFAKIGRLLSDDSIDIGQIVNSKLGDRTAAQTMYPNMNE